MAHGCQAGADPSAPTEYIRLAGTWQGTLVPRRDESTEVHVTFNLVDSAGGAIAGVGAFSYEYAGVVRGWQVTVSGTRAPRGRKLNSVLLGGSTFPLVKPWDLVLQWTEIMTDPYGDRGMQTSIGGGAPASGILLGELGGARSDAIVLKAALAADINPGLEYTECTLVQQCFFFVMTRN